MLIPKKVMNVSRLANAEPTRYASDGVQVRRVDDKCVAAATDSRRLIEVTWSDKELRPEYAESSLNSEPVNGFEVVIPVNHWDEASKLSPKNGARAIDETTNNGKYTIGTADRSQTRKIEGECSKLPYPKYESLIPEHAIGQDAAEIYVDPKLLAEVCHVLRAIATDEKNRSIRLVVPLDSRRPLVFEANADGISALALLMPIRRPEGWPAGNRV